MRETRKAIVYKGTIEYSIDNYDDEEQLYIEADENCFMHIINTHDKTEAAADLLEWMAARIRQANLRKKIMWQLRQNGLLPIDHIAHLMGLAPTKIYEPLMDLEIDQQVVSERIDDQLQFYPASQRLPDESSGNLFEVRFNCEKTYWISTYVNLYNEPEEAEMHIEDHEGEFWNHLVEHEKFDHLQREDIHRLTRTQALCTVLNEEKTLWEAFCESNDPRVVGVSDV